MIEVLRWQYHSDYHKFTKKDFCLFISLQSPTSSPKIRPNWRFISNHSRYIPIGPQFNSIRENCAQINLNPNQIFSLKVHIKIISIYEKDWTRSSWLNCALRFNEAVYWVSIGQQLLVLGGTGSVWGDEFTDPWHTHSQTLKDSATQLHRSRNGALVTQSELSEVPVNRT